MDKSLLGNEILGHKLHVPHNVSRHVACGKSTDLKVWKRKMSKGANGNQGSGIGGYAASLSHTHTLMILKTLVQRIIFQICFKHRQTIF